MTGSSQPPIASPVDHPVLGEADFGTPGPAAVVSVGPLIPVRACGPSATVYGAAIAASRGIGHHPRRSHERFFCPEKGTFDHDGARNGTLGRVPEGARARSTEGRNGMTRREWSHGEGAGPSLHRVWGTGIALAGVTPS